MLISLPLEVTVDVHRVLLFHYLGLYTTSVSLPLHPYMRKGDVHTAAPPPSLLLPLALDHLTRRDDLTFDMGTLHLLSS